MKYLIILGVLVLAWAPWLSREEALNIVDSKVAQLQEQNKNLCALFINRDSIRKIPFGYTEEVSYDCTITDTGVGVGKLPIRCL